MTEPDLAFESMTSLGARYRAGTLDPLVAAERLLDRIDRLNPSLHSFLALAGDRARTEAGAARDALRSGRSFGPLHGIPYAAKDLFDVKGMPTTGGTRLRADALAAEDAAAIRRLAAAGMALLGKTHTVQLAYGLVGINNDQGTPRNPWSREPHAPGGSSSGSAVAVAAGLVPVALGTDTGGSVRVPAALCGIVGLKTTVGRVSRAGVFPLSWTFDSVGCLARTVEDAALVAQALQGEDPADESTRGVAAPDLLRDLSAGVRGLRLAFGETLFFEDVDPEVERAVREAGEVFRTLGAHVGSVSTPEVAEVWTEAKRSHLIAAEACTLNHDLLERHFDALDPIVVQRMIAGRSLPATEYLGLLRRIAERRERLVRRLGDVDALLVPTTMDPARPLRPLEEDREEYFRYNARLHRNAGLGNLLQLCGVSVPCGFTSAGLPIGLLVYAKPFQEALALRVTRAYEQATEWRERRPDLAWAEGAEARRATAARS